MLAANKRFYPLRRLCATSLQGSKQEMRAGGQTFAGTSRFDLRGRLGDGGGGVVYRAFDSQLGSEVALKLMHRRDGDGLAYFRHSFTALKRLAHPNLVRLYDLVDDGEQMLLVMELVEGVELLSYVRTGRARGPSDLGSTDAPRDSVLRARVEPPATSSAPFASDNTNAHPLSHDGFDELRVRAAFGQLAQGLCALHQERKVHRDVKPANVRVTAQGRVVLLDLDFAIDLDVERSDRALGYAARPVGTAVYMAPEQAASLRFGTASDWYSMGVVLYEALTGRRPYSGTDLEVLLEKQETRPIAPGELVAGLPPDLERLCIDLLSPDPAERPSGPEILRRLGVHEDVLSARWTAASRMAARPAFVGRVASLARIQQAFERSRSAAVVVRVIGEAGVGKTSLGEEARRQFARTHPDALVLASACSRYPDKPHAPLHEPIARLTDALCEGRGASGSRVDEPRASTLRLAVSASALRLLERAFPGAVVGLEAKKPGRTAPPPEPLEQRWRAIGALRAMFAELAAHRPVVLWLDDYQWADVDTRRLVSSLIAGPDAPRMLLLLSEEPEPGGVHASEPPAHDTVELASLSSDEARLLIDELLERTGEVTRELEDALRPRSPAQCSPLLIQERVRHALLFEELPHDELDLAGLMVHRLAQLPDSSRRVLELVCAAFDATPQAVIERAAELSPAAFMREVAGLAMAGLLRSTTLHGEDALAPNHPLIAEFVDLELHGPRRLAVHQRLASALIERDAARASGRLLRHQGESGDHLRAADSALLSAEQAYAGFAFQRAAELFTLCASLKPPAQDERGHRLLRRMAEALSQAGWLLSAAPVYRQAAQFASAADALHMQQRSLECLLRGGEVEDGEQALDELLGSLAIRRVGSPALAIWSLRLHALSTRLFGLAFRERSEAHVPASELRKVDVLFASGAQLSLVDAVRGAELLSRALVAARQVGEPQRVARALCTEAWNCVGVSTSERARSYALLDAARTISEHHEAPLLDGHLRLAQGMTSLAGHRVRESSTSLRDAERVFRDSCSDVSWELSVAQVHQLLALSMMGHYRNVAPKLALFSREAEERGDTWSTAALLGVDALGNALANDAPESAEQRVREAESRWRTHESLHTQALLGLVARTAIDLYARVPGADERFVGRLDELEVNQWRRVRFVRVTLLELSARTQLLAAARRRDLGLLRGAEADARRLFAIGEPAASGFAHLLLANVHSFRNEHARAQRFLESALGELSPLGLGQWVVPARVALGRSIGGERGFTMEAAARSQLRLLGVQRPDRFVSMMLPAFRLD
ncbi:MAG: hypothetical protein RLZZ450_3472 [Pseudomonadota bacterium]